ncbi:MAG: alpha/beta hydrolase [Nakamurella sp.]
MPEVQINGNRLVIEVFGDDGLDASSKPVLIAHHGAPGLASRAEPRASFGKFADICRVVVYDARGSGASEGQQPYSHGQWTADIDAVREWMGVEQVIMAGGSYGGFLSLEYAIAYPDRVRALVLRDTAANDGFEAMARAAALADTRVQLDMDKFNRVMAGQVRDNDDLRDCWREILPLYDFVWDPAAVEAKVAATPYRFEAHNWAFTQNLPQYDLTAQLPQITAPTLITVGRVDWITPVACSEELAAGIPGSEMVVFEKSGHSPQIEQADEWEATVRRFLADRVGIGAGAQER